MLNYSSASSPSASALDTSSASSLSSPLSDFSSSSSVSSGQALPLPFRSLWSAILFISHACHDHDTRSTLYHSIWSRPHVYRPFHCMYLRFPIVSIFLVSLPIGEHFVRSVFPYDYLICFCLRSWLLSVPVPLYLLIQYTSGNRPRTSPGLLITLRELCWSSACPTPRASPHTFYNSI